MKTVDFIVKSVNGGIKVPKDYRAEFNKLIEFCEKNRGGFLRVKLSPPFKKRSTGCKSQNHHINGHIQQIANETGEEFDRLKILAKQKAVKYGYPIRTDIFGNAVPVSETEISSEEASFLIEAVHEMAAFLDIKLRE